ncbi:hypothetical protein MUCCIDRAFT_112151 [Mucor lusitanicus CBS 277.49]|uniref:Uncharacterized protein n=1 Tax=Mucor lusitanicus CBS 277.49 TaxID=747725 RepID=A0A168J4K8_MUCCL|nr:hypothetical protein MUCCIDRAFT_112151 [Mucor lusitanicus CBS 277.49]
MSSCKYLEIFNSLYKALAVNASPTAETSRDITFCNDSYNAALETYSANLLLLKKDIFAGAGATLDNCDFLKAEGRAQAKRQLDASYGSRVSTRAFDINLRFSARITLVNITLEPYPTIINSMYVLLQNGDESNPETCERLAPHYYALIREFKRLLEARLGAYSRERFESEFRLEWRE